MMTVFWYYRPHELEGVATQGISFQNVSAAMGVMYRYVNQLGTVAITVITI